VDLRPQASSSIPPTTHRGRAERVRALSAGEDLRRELKS
jgi:hypothetical protein